MRITVKPPKPVGVAAEKAAERPARTVSIGKEDLFLVFVIALILVGLGLGKLTFQEALAYFGVTSAGGVWGWLGGNASR